MGLFWQAFFTGTVFKTLYANFSLCCCVFCGGIFCESPSEDKRSLENSPVSEKEWSAYSLREYNARAIGAFRIGRKTAAGFSFKKAIFDKKIEKIVEKLIKVVYKTKNT